MPSTEPSTVDVLDHEPWPVATTPEAALARVHGRARQIRLRRRVPAGVSALAAIGLIAALVAPGSSSQSLDVGPADDHQVEVDREVGHDGTSVGVSAGASLNNDRRLPEGHARVTNDGEHANPIVGGVDVSINHRRATASALSRFLLVTDPEGDATGTACPASQNGDCLAELEGQWQHSEPSADVLSLYVELDPQVTHLGFRMEYLDLSSDIRENPSHRDGNVRHIEYAVAFEVDEALDTTVVMEVIRTVETGELRGYLRAWRTCPVHSPCESSRHDLPVFALDLEASTITVSATLDQINTALSEVTEIQLDHGSVLRSLRTHSSLCGTYPDGPACARTGLDATSRVESYTLEPGGN